MVGRVKGVKLDRHLQLCNRLVNPSLQLEFPEPPIVAACSGLLTSQPRSTLPSVSRIRASFSARWTSRFTASTLRVQFDAAALRSSCHSSSGSPGIRAASKPLENSEWAPTAARLPSTSGFTAASILSSMAAYRRERVPVQASNDFVHGIYADEPAEDLRHVADPVELPEFPQESVAFFRLNIGCQCQSYAGEMIVSWPGTVIKPRLCCVIGHARRFREIIQGDSCVGPFSVEVLSPAAGAGEFGESQRGGRRPGNVEMGSGAEGQIDGGESDVGSPDPAHVFRPMFSG